MAGSKRATVRSGNSALAGMSRICAGGFLFPNTSGEIVVENALLKTLRTRAPRFPLRMLSWRKGMYQLSGSRTFSNPNDLRTCAGEIVHSAQHVDFLRGLLLSIRTTHHRFKTETFCFRKSRNPYFHAYVWHKMTRKMQKSAADTSLCIRF